MAEESRNSIVPSRTTPLDRAAFERVLSRAAELQASGAENSELFSEQQLVELGKEVGLSPLHIRQAIAEERTRISIPTDGRGAADYFGPLTIEARRLVRLPAAVALQRLERWMDKEECLQPKRRLQERITWEARRDFLGSVRRGFNVGGRGYALSSAHEVGAMVTQVDDHNVLVHLTADFSNTRKRAFWGALGTAGVFTSGALATMAAAATLGGSLVVAGVIAAGLVGAGGGATALMAKANRELAARGQLALEQALDQIEQGQEPVKTVLGTLLNAAVRELR